MTAEEHVAYLRTKLVEGVNSWEDFYRRVDDLMVPVKETAHPVHVFNALYIMYGFLASMRELPDEGDIKVLAERTIHILVYEAEAKLGVRLRIVDQRDIQTELDKAAQRFAQAVTETLEGMSGSTAPEGPEGTKKFLH